MNLFCLAAERASAADGFPASRKGCTSLHSCETKCSLPDTRLLCSNFSHVAVQMANAFPPHPVVVGRVCDAGHTDEVEEEEKCVPGGHACWRRILDLVPSATNEQLPPLALNEALDFLSWIWRARFPLPAQGLIILMTSTNAAEIAQSCSNLVEFRSRMNALVDVLDSLKIDVTLIDQSTKDADPTAPTTPTLKRMHGALKRALPPEAMERAHAGMAVLQNIVTLRNGLIHSDAAKKVPTRAQMLGIEWPPSEWPRTWGLVRDRATTAVREIRQAIASTI